MFMDYGYTSFKKYDEELCGDQVAINNCKDNLTLILADGLGSGVKANILATLTAKILCTLISKDLPIKECVDTLIAALPVCRQRNLAYSTFSIVNLNRQGKGYLIEFDNPSCLYLSDGRFCDLDMEKIDVYDKTIYKTELNLKENDTLILFSDGVVYAGKGKALNYGWQRKDIMQYLQDRINDQMSAACIASILANASETLYMHEPLDDTTAAVIRCRKRQTVNIAIGPPLYEEDCQRYMNDFLNEEGSRIVCGGTTAKIVADHLGRKVISSNDDQDTGLPPISRIEGIDLVTEGLLTLQRLSVLADEYIRSDSTVSKQFNRNDGASLLADHLFEKATKINFFIGKAINDAHEGNMAESETKSMIIDKLIDRLRLMGKEIDVKYY